MREFETLCCQTEAILNSRPLGPLSSDPNDVAAITPGHFLTGRPLRCIAQSEIPTRDFPLVQNWQLMEAMTQEFWRRWRTEYLYSLQTRPKWFRENPNLSVGRLVIIDEPKTPPQVWKLGIITKVFPGADKVVRSAEVRTQNGVLTRPVQKLYPLPPAV